MTTFRTFAGTLSALALALLPHTAFAAIRYFSFSIPGFTYGAAIEGTFAGEDLDGDGSLVQLPQFGLEELTAFSATFSGDYVAPGYTWGLDAFNGAGTRLFVYRFDGDFSGLNNGNGEGIALFPAPEPGQSNHLLLGGSLSNPDAPGFIYLDEKAGIYEMSSSPGVVTELAAPGAPAPLLGLGLLPALAGAGGLAATRRRRRVALG